jgi:Domain of unknown function (DUF6316)
MVDNKATDGVAAVRENLGSTRLRLSVMDHRKNEPRKTWFRSDRIFRSNNQWYFQTREGIDVGPFNSEFEAQVEASILKQVLNGVVDPSTAISTIREFVLDMRAASSDLKGFTSYVEKEGRL